MPNSSVRTLLLTVSFLSLAMALLPVRDRAARGVPSLPNVRSTQSNMHGGSPARNMVNLIDRNIVSNWSAESKKPLVNIKWKAQLGSRGYGTPIVSGGKVFIGTNNDSPRNKRDRAKPNDDHPDGAPLDKGILMCLEESSGKFLWQAVHDKLGNDFSNIGIISTVAVEGNRLWYVNNRAEVVCADINGFLDGFNDGEEGEAYLDKTDADFIWRFDMIGTLNVFPNSTLPCMPLAACSPLLVGDRIFVVTGNGVDEKHIKVPSPDAPSFIALDKKTGKLLWKSNLPGKNIMNGQWSSPAYGIFRDVPTVIFPGGDGWIYGLKPETGELIWKFDAYPKDAIHKLNGRGTKNDFIAMPVVYKERIYIGSGQDPGNGEGVGHFWCFAPGGKTGDISPELVVAGAKPVKTIPNPNSAVVWHYGGEENRKFAKREHVFGRTMSTACIVDDVVYIPELAGYLHCLDANTGKKFWEYDTRSAIWGSCFYVDGKVYIGTEDGDMFVFRHNAKHETLDEVAESAKEVDEMNAKKRRLEVHNLVAKRNFIVKIEFDEPIRSTPSAANSVLYIATEKYLYAIAARK